jgi:hypothetical protein
LCRFARRLANNDLSVGRLVEVVAHSPYACDTAIIVTEDAIEDILGTPHINLNIACQRPMADVFDIRPSGH